MWDAHCCKNFFKLPVSDIVHTHNHSVTLEWHVSSLQEVFDGRTNIIWILQISDSTQMFGKPWKTWSISSWVWPVRKYEQVTLKRFFEETWLAAQRRPPLFLNSRLVLSCCRCTCICDNGSPLSRSLVSIAAKISIEALESFFVSGRPTPNMQQWPCAMHATTCIRIFCRVANSLPRVMELLGISNLLWSMPSATNTKVLERRRESPRASQ